MIYILFFSYKDNRFASTFLKNDFTILYYIFHSNNNFLEKDLYIFNSKFMNKVLNILYLYTQKKKIILVKKIMTKKNLLTKIDIYSYQKIK